MTKPISPIPISQAYRFCPQCGAESLPISEGPFRCPQCSFTQFFGPVAAVGALVVDDQNRLLLLRRARNPGQGMLGLPGGFVDPGETIEEALEREVTEETSLQIQHADLLVSFPNRYEYQGLVSPVIDLFYVCKVRDISKIELQVAEVDQYHWVSPGEEPLDQMAFESNRRAIELFRAS